MHKLSCALDRRRLTYAPLVAVLLAASLRTPGPVAAQTRDEIPPLTARWQTLPKEVRGITIGPDRRTWLQFSTSASRPLDEVQAGLAAETKADRPQIHGAELALIEPAGGRVWFYVDTRRKLIGYDGSAWIERTVSSPARPFIGFCPTLGRLKHGALENVAAAGQTFIMDQAGVHTFDGKAWTYLEFPKDQPNRYAPVLFAASPSGRWVVLIAQGGKAIWSFEEGKWKERADLELEPGQGQGYLAVTDEGLIAYVNAGRRTLSWLRLHAGAPDPASRIPATPRPPTEDETKVRIAELVLQLDDDSFAVRNSAQAELNLESPKILPQLAAAQEVAKSEEVRQRLAMVIAELKTKPNRPEPPPAQKLPATPFGDVEIRGVGSLYQDAAGRLYATAEYIEQDGYLTRSGIVLLAPDGQARVLEEPAATFALLRFQHGHSAPILSADGEKLWIQRPPSAAGPICLDLATGEIVQEVPDGQYHYLTAVDPNGRHAYLSHYQTATSPGKLVMAYTADAPEDRLPIEIESQPLGPGGALVASDGSVWAHRADGISRFTAEGWTTIGPAQGSVRFLAAGINGEVLLHHKQWELWRGDNLLASGGEDLKAFIQEHRKLVAAAFHGSKLAPRGLNRPLPPIADSGGNIWLLENNQLAVLIDGQWRQAKDIPGLGEVPGDRRLIAPVGESVYITNMRFTPGRSESYLARVEGGEVRLTPTVLASTLHFQQPPLRDAAGSLWLTGDLRLAKSSAIRGQFVARLHDEGEAERIEDQGSLFAIDKSGNLWLTRGRTGFDNRLLLWRDGRARQTLEIAGVDRLPAMISDRPGSAFVFSSRGLEHLIAAGPEFDHFEHQGTYAVSGIVKGMQLCEYSGLGYLVVQSNDFGVQAGMRLNLIKLPEPASTASE